MKYTKIVIRFDDSNPILAEELICDIFFSFNLKGVVCDVPLNEKGRPDEVFDDTIAEKPIVNSITGFLPLIDSSESILEQIKKKASGLTSFDINVNIRTEIIDEKEWSESWKDYFEVTKITERITNKDRLCEERTTILSSGWTSPVKFLM